jgi:hypothetical protein
MNFQEYAIKARSTAIYPNRGGNLPYAALGLMEESFELFEKIEAGDREGIKKELGDVYWYLVALHDEAKIPIGDVSPSAPTDGIQLRQAGKELIESAAKICGVTKKVIRDDGGVVSTEKVKKIELLATRMLVLANEIAIEVESTPEEIFEINIAKLLSRKERGTLGGSGDNR